MRKHAGRRETVHAPLIFRRNQPIQSRDRKTLRTAQIEHLLLRPLDPQSRTRNLARDLTRNHHRAVPVCMHQVSRANRHPKHRYSKPVIFQMREAVRHADAARSVEGERRRAERDRRFANRERQRDPHPSAVPVSAGSRVQGERQHRSGREFCVQDSVGVALSGRALVSDESDIVVRAFGHRMRDKVEELSKVLPKVVDREPFQGCPRFFDRRPRPYGRALEVNPFALG